MHAGYAAAMPESAVTVDGVSKTFRIPVEQVHTLKERALHPFRRTTYDTLRALREVSFEVEEGEFFGILGRNGSGKSTLLKCLAGIYRADSGAVFVNGRMSTFIELGVGFNPDLAAYDNVIINATMLGLSQREARARFERIIEFAELEEFVDLKIKNYSSGMLVRLAFSVMIQVDADILLIDEVLAVGDAAFQQKCFDEFARIRRAGTTVLLVTHDVGAVNRFCDRALLLERGRVVTVGDPETVGNRYLELNFSKEAREAERRDDDDAPAVASQTAAPAEGPAPDDRNKRLTDGTAEIVDAWFADDAGKRMDVLQTRGHYTFNARVRFRERLQDPAFGVTLQSSQDDHVFGANNLREPPSGTFEAGEEVVFSLRFPGYLAPDRYWVTPAVATSTGGHRWHDHRPRMLSIMVSGSRRAEGLLEIPFEFSLERVAPVRQEAVG
jgi:ABC-type polysaccharide/polyol phosphate transport system ATPase subunit